MSYFSLRPRPEPLPPWPTREEIEAVRADPELSDVGKARKLADMHAAATPRLPTPVDRPDRRVIDLNRN